MPDNSRRSVTERNCGDHSTRHQKVSDENKPYAESTAIGLCGPLTRAQKTEGPASHRPCYLTKETSRKKLSTKETRKLR